MIIRRLIFPVGLALSVALVPTAAGAAGGLGAKTAAPPKAGHWSAKKSGEFPGAGTFTLGPSRKIKKLKLRGGNADCSNVRVTVASQPKVTLQRGAGGKANASEWAVGKVDDDVLEGTPVTVKGARHRLKGELSMAFPHPTGAGSTGRLMFRTPVGGLCTITFKMKKG
jgi:hypothetical protein